jgi:putative membrane protein
MDVMAALVTVAALGGLSAPRLQERVYEWSWSGHPMAWMWGLGGLVMMLMMFLFWALVIFGIVFGIRWLVRQGGGDRADRALEILRERYARGEIGKEEFETRRRDLEVARR